MPDYYAQSGDVVFVNSEQGPDAWTVYFPPTPKNNYRVSVADTSTTRPTTPITFDFQGNQYLHSKLNPTSGTSIDLMIPGETWEWVFNADGNFWYPLDDGELFAGLRLTDVKTAAYTAVARDYVQVDTTTGDKTITLPASPNVNDRVGVYKIGTSDTGVVVVDAGTNTIIPATSVVFSLTQAALINATATAIWRWDGTRWFPESRAHVGGILDIWSATPIVGISPVGQTIQWTYVPRYTGQTPSLFTESAGVFTAQVVAGIDVSTPGEWTHVIAANNSDTELSIESVFSGAGLNFYAGINQPFSHARAASFTQSGSADGLFVVVAADTLSFTATGLGSGASTVDLDELTLFFTAD